ncbi:MAG: efflux RND transporter periplasmic adaptor subunit [Saprospiraceae bacterium]|nr:efflux RND transporter periplasmic adaptor subunit [Saprospiraceae bacterium]
MKKIAGILIPIIIIILVVYRLISTKAETDAQLQKMMEYNEVVPVKIISASKHKVVHSISESGIFESSQQIDVVSETQGIVLEISANIGDFVMAGQKLISVEKGLLTSQYKSAKINFENCKIDLKRFENLLDGDATTKRQYESIILNYQNSLTKLQQMEEQLNNTVITAPVSGFITRRDVGTGSYISPGMPLIGISQYSELQFVVQLSEDDILKVKKGDSAEIMSSVFENNQLIGIVNEIAVNTSMSGRYNVSLRLPNPPSDIKPGMSGKAIFRFSDAIDGITIPRKCLVGSILNAKVFVITGNSAIKKSISATNLNENEVLIHSGLKSGENVVLAGQINLEEGTKVKIIN